LKTGKAQAAQATGEGTEGDREQKRKPVGDARARLTREGANGASWGRIQAGEEPERNRSRGRRRPQRMQAEVGRQRQANGKAKRETRTETMAAAGSRLYVNGASCGREPDKCGNADHPLDGGGASVETQDSKAVRR
jgi:hypothetical protein